MGYNGPPNHTEPPKSQMILEFVCLFACLCLFGYGLGIGLRELIQDMSK